MATKNLPLDTNIKNFQRIDAEQRKRGMIAATGQDPDNPSAKLQKPIFGATALYHETKGELVVKTQAQHDAAIEQGYRDTPYPKTEEAISEVDLLKQQLAEAMLENKRLRKGKPA